MDTIENPPMDPSNWNGNQWIDAVYNLDHFPNQFHLW